MDDSIGKDDSELGGTTSNLQTLLESDAGKAAIAASVETATAGLKSKRDELLEANRKLKDELAARQEESVKTLSKLNRASATVQQLLVDNGLSDALTMAKVAPEFVPAARALIKSREDIAIGDTDGQPTAVIGEQSLAEYVAQWADSDEGRPFIAPPANSGGGTVVSASGRPRPANPWSKDSRNLSEQARILREDPERAARLKVAAE